MRTLLLHEGRRRIFGTTSRGFWLLKVEEDGARVVATSLSKHLSLSLPAWLRPFSLGAQIALFEGSSLDFFLKTRFAREGRVLCSFKGFSGDEGAKSGFFCSRTTRVFRSPSEGAERRTRARRVLSLSRNEKDAYFLSLFFFLECATENAADGVNKNKTTREDGSTTNNRRAGKERR